MITITLQQILASGPCYDPIAKYGLKERDRDAPISFRKIVEVAGAQDAIWCFAMALPGHEALKRHFAVDCAERVQHLMQDPRSREALEVTRRHALGQAPDEELTAVRATASDAAWSAADTAVRAAAWSAETAADAAKAIADSAAWAAAWSAAWAIVGDATDDATYIAARTVAWFPARAAEINWQGRRLIDLTEAGVWTPVEEADKRGWSSYGH